MTDTSGVPRAALPHTLGCFRWEHRDEDFCRPSTCPRCGAVVFFVRHNGGSVWFDTLGKPWPKHGCFDEDRYGVQLRRRLTEHLGSTAGHPFGVVLEAETTRPGEGGHIVIRCSDGTLLDQEFDTRANLSQLLGRLVLVVRNDQGAVSLEFISPAQPRVIAYLRIIENGTSRLVEEYAYRRRPEAEERLASLLTQHPGRYRLETTRRTEY